MMTHNKLPIISILIPYYNEEGKIRNTMESLLLQTFHDIEIVCVDDGSTDNTLKELISYAEKDKRVKIVTKPNEGMPAKAIDFGIRHILGQYFFYSSKDDLFDLDFFEKLYNKIISSNAEAVVPNIVFDYGNGNYSKGIFGLKGDYSKEISGLEAAQYCLDSYTISGNALFSADIVKSIGCKTFSYNSDEYTAKLYYLKCQKIVFCDTNFYYRQDDPDAYTKKWSPRMIQALETNRKYEELAVENNFDPVLVQKIKEDRISLFVELVLKFESYKFELKKEQQKKEWINLKQEYQKIIKDVRSMNNWIGVLGMVKKGIYSGPFEIFVWWIKKRKI